MKSAKNTTKTFSCPHCSATEIEFIAPGMGRCKYCGARIDLPKEEKQYDPNNPFDVLGSVFGKNDEPNPRADVIDQLYYPLSKNEAETVQRQTFKKTMPLWIFALVCIFTTIAMCVVAGLNLCSVKALVAVAVPMAVTTIATICAIVINGRHAKKLLAGVQQKRVDEVSEDLERNLFAPLTSIEIDKALSSTGRHRFSLISKRNIIQLSVCMLFPLLFIASCIVAPLSAASHKDTIVEGVCDRCGKDLHESDYIFELNEYGTEYTLTGVAGKFDMGFASDYDVYVSIPSSHNGLPVTRIGAGAFSNTGNHFTLIIPDSIEVIEAGAFASTDLLEIEFETYEDWYLVEAGEWLTEHTILYPTPQTFCKATFFLFGNYTWAKSPWSI